MTRLIKTLLLTLLIFVGGWLLYHRQQIQSFSDAASLAGQQIGFPSSDSWNPFQLVETSDFVQSRVYDGNPNLKNPRLNNRPPEQSPVIRVASFKLDSTTTDGKLKQTANICQQYDVVAIQNNSDLSVSRLVSELNKRGFDYRFVDQRGTSQKFVTIFNQQTIVLEDQRWYSVNDPEDLFLFEPLVAWFRVANVPIEEAFTFTLANVQLNARQPDKELAYLGELFRAIRLDGRGEDDVILAGDFQSNDLQISKIHSATGLNAAIVNSPTNTRKNMQFDNLLFDKKATVEYSGESGVFDFMKRFNLTLVDALAISNRMPVWAEFAIFEGRTPGRAASDY